MKAFGWELSFFSIEILCRESARSWQTGATWNRGRLGNQSRLRRKPRLPALQVNIVMRREDFESRLETMMRACQAGLRTEVFPWSLSYNLGSCIGPSMS